eukprot:CAMPEP_0180527408 /NCGR_PEP_ID=MMETSP1036_2-20121128/60216_1 /TAXON_ID=632150 /ORGANISM="Azadinium spinosum, Strain 3D9" /LENGTH=43 /DNA_ID= /DNA_START= /DNA_END= /DNA_ORIENTATION=
MKPSPAVVSMPPLEEVQPFTIETAWLQEATVHRSDQLIQWPLR